MKRRVNGNIQWRTEVHVCTVERRLDKEVVQRGKYYSKAVERHFFDSSAKVENLNGVAVGGGSAALAGDASTGSFSSANREIIGYISYVDLIVDHSVPAGGSIAYQFSVDNGATWKDITPVSTDGGVTKNVANRYYFEDKGEANGSNIRLKANLAKGTAASSPVVSGWTAEIGFTAYATAVVINNDFPKNVRGIKELDGAVHTTNPDRTGYISLERGSGGYVTDGTVKSTMRRTANDAVRLCLQVEEDTPAGTDIVYSVSTQNGADGTCSFLRPGNMVGKSDWVALDMPEKSLC
jgi:hypothetical protein